MTVTPHTIPLTLFVHEPYSPDSSICSFLVNEIIDSIPEINPQYIGDTIPPGARGGEAITAGTIFIAILPIFLDKFLDFLRHWVNRHDAPSITVSIPHANSTISITYTARNAADENIADFIQSAKALVDAQGKD